MSKNTFSSALGAGWGKRHESLCLTMDVLTNLSFVEIGRRTQSDVIRPGMLRQAFRLPMRSD